MAKRELKRSLTREVTDKPIALRLPIDLHTRIWTIAKADRRKFNDMIRLLLEDSVTAKEMQMPTKA